MKHSFMALFVLVLPACTDHYGSPTMTYSEYGASSWQWLNAYPNRVDISWSQDTYNCVGENQSRTCDGGQAHKIRLNALACDGCTLLEQVDGGFQPFPQTFPTTAPLADTISVYAMPTVVGTVTITADVETQDNVHDTASMQLAADRVASLSADCEVLGADFSTLGKCSQLAHRPADSRVDVVSLVSTSRGDSIVLSSYLPEGGAFPQYLPNLGPDSAVQLAVGDFEITGPTAPAETLSWDGVADPITIQIPPIQ